MEACNIALEEAGYNKVKSKVTILKDLDGIVNDFPDAVIVTKKEGRNVYYEYEDKSFSIYNIPLNDDEMAQLAQTISILSKFEGMPNSIMEAMAMGMPVVSTDCPCGGPREVIEDGVNGFLIPVGDEDALADRICRLIEDKDLRESFGKMALEIEKKASADAVFAQWKEYLESIVDG